MVKVHGNLQSFVQNEKKKRERRRAGVANRGSGEVIMEVMLDRYSTDRLAAAKERGAKAVTRTLVQERDVAAGKIAAAAAARAAFAGAAAATVNANLREPSATNSFHNKAWQPYESGAGLTPNQRTKLRAFINLRAIHTFGELIHDFGKAFIDSIFTTEATRLRLIETLYEYVPDGVFTGPEKAVQARMINTDFYPDFTTDGAAKKIILAEINKYLATYENISSLDSFGTEPYSTDGADATAFYDLIRDTFDIDPASGEGGNAAFYLDAQFGNFLADYYKYRRLLPGKNSFCKDLAYIVDPGSGWNPRTLYTELENYREVTFDAKYTGLGRNLRLDPVMDGGVLSYVSARWRGSDYRIRIYPRSNSVDETAALIQLILLYAAEPPGATREDYRRQINDTHVIAEEDIPYHTWGDAADPRYLQLIIDILYLKTAGDRNQNCSVNSDVWNMAAIRPIDPVEVSNDYLSIWDFILYCGRACVQTGSGFYRLFESGQRLDAELSDHSLSTFASYLIRRFPATAANLRPRIDAFDLIDPPSNASRRALLTALRDIGAATMTAYITSLIDESINNAKNYFRYSFRLLTAGQLPIFAKTQIQPAAGTLSVPSNTQIYVISNQAILGVIDAGMKANKLIAGVLTFIIDSMEKLSILDRMENQRANANVFNSIIPDLTAAAGVDGVSISSKYKPLIPENIGGQAYPVNMFKYTDLYSIYTPKASYNKLASLVSVFEEDLTRVAGLVDSALPRYIIYREISRALRSNITIPVPYKLIAFLLTFILYDITRPSYPTGISAAVIAADINTLTRTDLAARRRYDENIKRDQWISECFELDPADAARPDLALRRIVIGLMGYNLRGSVRLGAGPGLTTVVANNVGGTVYNIAIPAELITLNTIYETMDIVGTTYGYDQVKNTVNFRDFAPLLLNILKSMNNVRITSLEQAAALGQAAVTYGSVTDLTPGSNIDFDMVFNADVDDAIAYADRKEQDAAEEAAALRSETIRSTAAGAVAVTGVIKKIRGASRVAGATKRRTLGKGERVYAAVIKAGGARIQRGGDETFLSENDKRDLNAAAIAELILTSTAAKYGFENIDGLEVMANVSEFREAAKTATLDESNEDGSSAYFRLVIDLVAKVPVQVEHPDTLDLLVAEACQLGNLSTLRKEELEAIVVKGRAAGASRPEQIEAQRAYNELQRQGLAPATPTPIGVKGATLTSGFKTIANVRAAAAKEAAALRATYGIKDPITVSSTGVSQEQGRVRAGGARRTRRRRDRRTRRRRSTAYQRRRTIRRRS